MHKIAKQSHLNKFVLYQNKGRVVDISNFNMSGKWGCRTRIFEGVGNGIGNVELIVIGNETISTVISVLVKSHYAADIHSP